MLDFSLGKKTPSASSQESEQTENKIRSPTSSVTRLDDPAQSADRFIKSQNTRHKEANDRPAAAKAARGVLSLAQIYFDLTAGDERLRRTQQEELPAVLTVDAPARAENTPGMDRGAALIAIMRRER